MTETVLEPLTPPRLATFDLRRGARTSDSFYEALDRLTDETLGEAERRVGPLLDHLVTQLRPAPGRPVHRAERLLELLTIAAYLRASFPRGLGEADAEELASHLERFGAEAAARGDAALERVFAAWAERWRTLGIRQAWGLRSLQELGAWFEERSSTLLGSHTERIDGFVRRARKERRDDQLLRITPRLLYHLAMVTVAILNRVVKEDYDATERRILLLPGCMRTPTHPEGCQSVPSAFGKLCAKCSEGCRARRLSEFAAATGVQTFIQEEPFTAAATLADQGIEAGLVKVACVLQLGAAEREARALGIPFRGVFLDFCGCRAHWDAEGLTTDCSLTRLREAFELQH